MKVDYDKIREKLNELGKIVVFLQTDDETYEAGEDLEKIWTEAISLLPKPCSECGGSGEVKTIPAGVDDGSIPPQNYPCPACKGEIEEKAKEWRLLIHHIRATDPTGSEENLVKELEEACTHLEALLKQIKGLEGEKKEMCKQYHDQRCECEWCKS